MTDKYVKIKHDDFINLINGFSYNAYCGNSKEVESHILSVINNNKLILDDGMIPPKEFAKFEIITSEDQVKEVVKTIVRSTVNEAIKQDFYGDIQELVEDL